MDKRSPCNSEVHSVPRVGQVFTILLLSVPPMVENPTTFRRVLVLFNVFKLFILSDYIRIARLVKRINLSGQDFLKVD